MKACNFIQSFGNACRGLREAVKGERNLRFHLVAAGAVFLLAAFFHLKPLEWVALMLVVGLVIAAEMVNTAIEAVVDLASPDIHPLARRAKDVAAGAVLFLAFIAVAVGLVIFLPYLKRLF